MSKAQGGGDYWPWSTDRLPKGVPLSIRDIAGRVLRVVKYGQTVTGEHIPGRVTIYKTKDGRIESILIEAS